VTMNGFPHSCCKWTETEQDAMLSQRWPRDAPYSLYGWSENRLL